MSRKNKLVSLLLAVAFVAPALALAEEGASSGTDKKPMDKGLKIGLNIATFSGSDAEVTAPATRSSRIALVAGGYVGFPMGPITLQPEFLYSLKGSKTNADILGIEFTETTMLTYLDIPVLAKYELTPAPTKLSLFLGPSLGILLSAKQDVSIGILSSGDVDIKEFVSSTDLGLVFGAGASLAGFNLDVRYQMGLTSLDKPVAGATAAKIYNSVITVLVAIPL